MQSIGNDIVDLTLSNAVRRESDDRFVSRILTNGERNILESTSFPNHFLWIFWAAKESAYKALARLHPFISSAPRKYTVRIYDPITVETGFLTGQHQNRCFILDGEVYTPKQTVHVCVSAEKDFIHCVATIGPIGPGNEPLVGIRRIKFIPSSNPDAPSNESEMVRNLATTEIAAHLRIDPSEIVIRRTKIFHRPGPPVLWVQGQRQFLNISFSHDGRFLAYACSDLR